MRDKLERYFIRKQRLRKKIFGTGEKPRLSVYHSLKHTYAQIINDEEGKILVAVSTLTQELRKKIKSGSNILSAQAVGELIAKKALEKGIRKVVFDRGARLYHGRVKALAEAARQGGLGF